MTAWNGRLASSAPEAAEAVALFVYRVGREPGSLAAAAWLGVRLDPAANLGHGPRISTADSPVSAWVIPTDEEPMIARHTLACIRRGGPR